RSIRRVVRGGTQPVPKTGPTSRSKVRLLHLPPIRKRRHGQAGHWRAQGAVNAPHQLWWFNSIPAHQCISPRTWLNGRVPERHSGDVGSTPAVRTNSKHDPEKWKPVFGQGHAQIVTS